jgi:hypothetical protein
MIESKVLQRERAETCPAFVTSVDKGYLMYPALPLRAAIPTECRLLADFVVKVGGEPGRDRISRPAAG